MTDNGADMTLPQAVTPRKDAQTIQESSKVQLHPSGHRSAPLVVDRLGNWD